MAVLATGPPPPDASTPDADADADTDAALDLLIADLGAVLRLSPAAVRTSRATSLRYSHVNRSPIESREAISMEHDTDGED